MGRRHEGNRAGGRPAARRPGRLRRPRRSATTASPVPASSSRWRASDGSSTAMRRAPVAPSARPSTTRACVKPAVITHLRGVGDDPAGPPEVLDERGPQHRAALGIAVAEGVGAGVGERPPHGGHPPGAGEQRQIGIAAGEVGERRGGWPDRPPRGRPSQGRRDVGDAPSARPAGSRRAPRRPAARRRRRPCPWPGRGRRPGRRVDGSTAPGARRPSTIAPRSACSTAACRPPSGGRVRSSSTGPV